MDDLISRQAAIDALEERLQANGYSNVALVSELNRIIGYLMRLPSAQPERTCVNCGRTVNNGGWYADGRTRCPIEEHYALPIDCEELERGKHWDGHTEKDVTRLLSLPDVPDINDGDIISRQAAIDALDKRFDNVPMELTMEILQLRRDLRELPSAQPEIIRCKECKNHNLCAIEDEARDETFFCKWGERRN